MEGLCDRLAGLPGCRGSLGATSSRWVAAMVVVLSLATVVSGEIWMLALLAYGYAVRAAGFHGLSPMAVVAGRAILPLLRVRSEAVPPDGGRLGEALGLAMCAAALALHLGGLSATPARGVLGALTLIAAAEAIFGLRAAPAVLAAARRAGVGRR